MVDTSQFEEGIIYVVLTGTGYYVGMKLLDKVRGTFFVDAKKAMQYVLSHNRPVKIISQD